MDEGRKEARDKRVRERATLTPISLSLSLPNNLESRQIPQNKVKYDGTQEILLEPELLRNCPLGGGSGDGSGPRYQWTIWDEEGHEWDLSHTTRLDTPTLLLHPVYDQTAKPNWMLWLLSRHEEEAIGKLSLLYEPMVVDRTMKAGAYEAQLAIQEGDNTAVRAAFNTSFSVVAIRLRATFLGGTEREVEAGSNITLIVEVTTPTPNYTLKWDCTPEHHPDTSCFQVPGIWNTFTTQTYAGNNLFTRIHHLWDIMNDGKDGGDGQEDDRRSYDDGTSHSHSGTHSPNYSGNPEYSDSPFYNNYPKYSRYPSYSNESPSPESPPKTHELPEFLHTNRRYIETVTIPPSSLAFGLTHFRFSVTVRYRFKTSNDSQIIILNYPRDSIGIVSHLRSQFPFGAIQRMVFESECLSCTEEDLTALNYTWSLKRIVKRSQLRWADTGNRRVKSQSKIEELLERSLQQYAAQNSVPSLYRDPSQYLVPSLYHTFLPRPRDYLRVYSKVALQAFGSKVKAEEPPTPFKSLLTTQDSDNLSKNLTPKILARAEHEYSRWAARRKGRQRRSALPTPELRAPLHASHIANNGIVEKSQVMDNQNEVEESSRTIEVENPNGMSSSGAREKMEELRGVEERVKRSRLDQNAGSGSLGSEVRGIVRQRPLPQHSSPSAATSVSPSVPPSVREERKKNVEKTGEAREAGVMKSHDQSSSSLPGGVSSVVHLSQSSRPLLSSQSSSSLPPSSSSSHPSSSSHSVSSSSSPPPSSSSPPSPSSASLSPPLTHFFKSLAHEDDNNEEEGQLFPFTADPSSSLSTASSLIPPRIDMEEEGEGKEEVYFFEENKSEETRIRRKGEVASRTDDNREEVNERRPIHTEETGIEIVEEGMESTHNNGMNEKGMSERGGVEKRKTRREHPNTSDNVGRRNANDRDTKGMENTKRRIEITDKSGNSGVRVNERGGKEAKTISETGESREDRGKDEMDESAAKETGYRETEWVASESAGKTEKGRKKREEGMRRDNRPGEKKEGRGRIEKRQGEKKEGGGRIGKEGENREEEENREGGQGVRSRKRKTVEEAIYERGRELAEEREEREGETGNKRGRELEEEREEREDGEAEHERGREEKAGETDNDRGRELEEEREERTGVTDNERGRELEFEREERGGRDAREEEEEEEGEKTSTGGFRSNSRPGHYPSTPLQHRPPPPPPLSVLPPLQQQIHPPPPPPLSVLPNLQQQNSLPLQQQHVPPLLPLQQQFPLPLQQQHPLPLSILFRDVPSPSPTYPPSPHLPTKTTAILPQTTQTSSAIMPRKPTQKTSPHLKNTASSSHIAGMEKGTGKTVVWRRERTEEARARRLKSKRGRGRAKWKSGRAGGGGENSGGGGARDSGGDGLRGRTTNPVNPLSLSRKAGIPPSHDRDNRKNTKISESSNNRNSESSNSRNSDANSINNSVNSNWISQTNDRDRNPTEPKPTGSRNQSRGKSKVNNNKYRNATRSPKSPSGRNPSQTTTAIPGPIIRNWADSSSHDDHSTSLLSSSAHTPVIVEGRSWKGRDDDYMKKLTEYVKRTGDLPNLSCRPDHWEECAARPPQDPHNTTLHHTLGDQQQQNAVYRGDMPEVVDEDTQVDVIFLSQLTSTGVHNPVLVLYMDLLSTDQTYMLYLKTFNTRNNRTGLAKQSIQFSPSPKLGNCQVVELTDRQGPWFRASCLDVEGHYYPVHLQWSYHFLWLGVKTVFYHGTRTSIDFSLPSGLESNDYKMYISLRAIDGKGVSFKDPTTRQFQVEPRSNIGDGILYIFLEISALENESPPLLLQQVRSLAWDLNLVTSSHISQTVVDNILTISYYLTSCEDSLGTVTPSHRSTHANISNSFHPSQHYSSDVLLKVNLLKSCARDHLAEIVAKQPVRDEMEVLQVLTALQIIVDVKENISSTTFLRVQVAMHAATARMWFCYNVEIKTQATQEFFVLSSSMLDKQEEIYDWNSTSVEVTQLLISQLLMVLEVETRGRFVEEQPLTMYTDTLLYHGYWADADNINCWQDLVKFVFQPIGNLTGVYLIQSLTYMQSPYRIDQDPITSETLTLNVDFHTSFPLQVKVKLPRSLLAHGSDYDFRRRGVLNPGLLSVYKLEVRQKHQTLALQVLLQVTRLYNPQYPVAAVILICEDVESLHEPLYKVELMATTEPASVQLHVPPGELSTGNKIITIIDKNTYENNGAWENRTEVEMGAEYKISAWWSSCLVWYGGQWTSEGCSVNSNESSWDYTICSCQSEYSVYGAQTLPILDTESKLNVNELLLQETYVALYFLVGVGVIYLVLALLLQTSQRHRLRRRNIWLRDNRPEHEWAYLLTIKTGTQWNAGTTSKVYAILHGIHGMSETRELQSKQTGQLFTRGALCTFIVTTPESLGDILKVQVWHDNSGGDASGWFVCEASVADLVLRARYVYPCYRWLSVHAEDAKVEREITLESPTKFLQDFEHFLPQYASEHMLWASLLTTSSTAKLYRLQRLTICLIVCLCLGTISLSVVQSMNRQHTMMVPDMHIEPLYYGVVIAAALLPVQWLLEMIFKMSNRLEEKEYNAKAVLDTLRATQARKANTLATPSQEESSQETDDEDDDDIYDPNAPLWQNLTSWAKSIDIPTEKTGLLHPSLRLDEEWLEGMEVKQRSKRSIDSDHSVSSSSFTENETREEIESMNQESFPTDPTQEGPSLTTNLEPPEDPTEKSSPGFLAYISNLHKGFNSILLFGSKSTGQRGSTEEDKSWRDEEDEEEDEEDERDELRISSSMTFILSQCVGWIMCCLFVALCCMLLFVRGSGMPLDYATLWVHIIYVTLCCSIFIMQPLVVVIYTFYKVCVYRWLDSRGCISSCVAVPLEQVVDIWTRYQAALTTTATTTHTNTSPTEKLLEERQRVRELRFARPPSEDHLLGCRAKEIQRTKVHSLLVSTAGHLLLLALLSIIASNAHVAQRSALNQAIYTALENGTCIDEERYLDSCSYADFNITTCNQILNEGYMKFQDIQTKEDWWKWAFTELLAFTYNEDLNYTSFNIFCDSNSVIIGTPRLRKYDSSSQECAASKFKIDNNRSMADLLDIKDCYPEYIDDVAHLYMFNSNMDKEYEWDAHFLAVTYGKYSRYSYTNHKQNLPTSRFNAIMNFYILQSSGWLDNNMTRAVVTDFTLYHPETNLYSTISLLAEFPSLSGVEVRVGVWSSYLERYQGGLSVACMLAEVIFLAVSMYYLHRATVYIYTSRFRIWRSVWGLLDVLMTLLAWAYLVCLMLRVQIAEDAMWQLRVAYFRKFVNLKGLVIWDDFLESLVGGMLAVHTVRCLSLARHHPRLRRLSTVIAAAAHDVFIISIVMVLLLVSIMHLGHSWFTTTIWEFHTPLQTILTLFKIVVAHLPFLSNIAYQASGYVSCLSYFYYLLTYVLLYLLSRALFMAAFIHARRAHKDKQGVDVKWKNISGYMKERFHSLAAKVSRKKGEEESHPVDNTPPGFYMAELEMQIGQVMGRLEGLAATLGSLVTQTDELGGSHQTPYSTQVDMTEVWTAESDEAKSSISSSEFDKLCDPSRHSVGKWNYAGSRPEQQRVMSSERREQQNNIVQAENYQNLEAFTDIESCQTEIDALTKSWNILPPPADLWAKDDGGRLEKFLRDVSEASDESVTSFGKYGKTQLKFNPKIHPSHESLTTASSNHSAAGLTTGALTGLLSSKLLDQPASQLLKPDVAVETEGLSGGCGRVVNSRFCRTQTQGRGKGHVDVLDVAALDLDSDNDE